MRSSQEDVWTVGKVLAWAATDFKQRGFDSPRLDAELLLGATLGLDRVRLIIESSRPLTGEELSRFKTLIVRRRACEPVAYLLGQREFHGLRFKVDSRVLVPRPDTEILVTVALRRSQTRSEFGHLLDLCTGSGCVALAFANARPTWHVTATDVSAAALAVASDNAQRLGSTLGVAFVHGDLFQNVPVQPFTLITANPPYIPTAEIPTLMKDVRDFEPHGALDGGPDGLQLVRRIIAEAKPYLAEDGVLALEVGHDQAARVASLLQGRGYTQIETDRDYAGIERVVSARLPEAR